MMILDTVPILCLHIYRVFLGNGNNVDTKYFKANEDLNNIGSQQSLY